MDTPPCDTCFEIIQHASCGHNQFGANFLRRAPQNILGYKIDEGDSSCPGCTGRRNAIFTHWKIKHPKELTLLILTLGASND